MADTADDALVQQAVGTNGGPVDRIACLEELAKHFAEVPEPSPEFQARLDELAEKSNEGALSPAEAREYDKYVEYMDFVALIRLKARARVSGAPCP